MLLFSYTKLIMTLLITLLMQNSLVGLASTTPEEAASDFLNGLKTGEKAVMEKHIDNSYVNFLVNVEGDEDVVARMNEALFTNFSFEILEIRQKNDAAAAKVIIRNADFSSVEKKYERISYDYIMDNLYTDEIADKEALNAKCLNLYVEQIEKASAKAGNGGAATKADSTANKAATEIEVIIPMVNDGYFGWNIIVDDVLMKAVLGNLQLPETVEAE